MLAILLAFGLAFAGCDNGSTGGSSSYTGGGTTSGGNSGGSTTTAPSAPTGVTATRNSTTPSTVRVSWNSVSGATSYNVYYSSTGTGSGSREGSPSTTSFNSTGNSTTSTVYFRVTAVNSAGEGSSSSWVSVPPVSGGTGTGTGTGTTQAPSVPSISGIELIANEAGLRIRWGSVTNAATYKVSRASTQYGSYSTIASNLRELAYDDTTVNLNSAGTSYWYKIIAVNSAGTESSPSAGKGITVPQSQIRLAISVTKSNGALRLTTTSGVTVIDLLTTTAGYTTAYRSINPGTYKVFTYMAGTSISSVPSASWVDGGTYIIKPYNSYTVTVTGARTKSITSSPISLVVLQ
jgi:hypothetical protein